VVLWSAKADESVYAPLGGNIPSLQTQVNGIRSLSRDDETQVMSVRVGGGSYHFTAQWM